MRLLRRVPMVQDRRSLPFQRWRLALAVHAAVVLVVAWTPLDAGGPRSSLGGRAWEAVQEDPSRHLDAFDLVFPPPTDPAADAAPAGDSSRVEDWVVRIIYFKPTDREPWPRLDEELDRAMRLFEIWLDNEMVRHGYAGRELRFEKHPDGRLMVHHFPGAYDTAHYQNAEFPWSEIEAELDANPDFSDLSREAQVVIPHVHFDHPDGTLEHLLWPITAPPSLAFNKGGGRARFDTSWILPAEQYLFDDTTPETRPSRWTSDDCAPSRDTGITVGSLASLNLGAWLHEMLHALGVMHERREADFSVMSGGATRFARSVSPHGPAPGVKIMDCHAKRLSRSPFFDPMPPLSDTTGPTVTILEPSFFQNFMHGQPIHVRARIQDADSGVGYVEFVGSGGGSTEHCVEPGGALDVTLEYDIRGQNPGQQYIYVRAIDEQGNTGPASEGSVLINVLATPSGPDLIPYGVCHDPPHPTPGTTVRVVGGIANIGDAAAVGQPLISWDRDVAGLPGGGAGDLEVEASSPIDANTLQFVELGTYTYGGGREFSAIRVDRFNDVSEIDEGGNGAWPLLFGAWPACHGGDPISGLAVSKSAVGDELQLSWTPTADPCHAAYRVFESETSVPANDAGQFPSDPDFRDISIDDLDGDRANTSFEIAMPSGNRFFLVTSEGQTGHSGIVEHYGE
ncbi:MAG: hypothetical protein JSV80_02410 [Acidobacteriota bacterium]|nr:MAG: hypothetical protein JSV80_02410 [Acidobacteriota bacterium]